MNNKQFYGFAGECVEQLGNLVGEMRKKGHTMGLTEEQTRKIWLTCFEVLEKKHRISRQIMSQNLKKKTPSPENV